MSKLKFGADPEFAAVYEEDGEKFILPPVVLRSDFNCEFEENDRHPIFKRYGDTYVHEDGAAFEMSTPPSHDWREIWNKINEVKEIFGREVLSRYPVCNPALYSLPAVKYQVDTWINRGPEFQMATMFGCDPDQDVYNTKVKCKVIDATRHPWRYMGGHIHASGLKEIEESPLIAIRCMVITAGLAATAFTDVPDLEKERLFLYGKPGKFRVQNYPSGEVGIEYRTPSTRWTDNLFMAEKVFTWATIGLLNLLKGGLFSEIEKEVETPAVEAILSVNQPKALEILNYIESRV
jgi:hypothetical protein